MIALLLTTQYADGNNPYSWQWGKVNELVIEHPFAKQIPILKKLLNMPAAPGFGDTFMPAVQGVVLVPHNDLLYNQAI